MMFPPTISVYVIYLVICIEVCRASYDEFVTRGIPWEFWGMTRDEYHNALDKAREYKDLRNAPGRPVASSTGSENRGTTWSGSSTQGVFLTGPQYQRLIDDYKAETPDARRDAHKRYRRKSVVFGDYYLKWKIPISFALHENFTATQRMVIRAATQHIETVTAVRFKEVEYLKQEGPILSISHYKKNPDICSSCIGMCGSDGGGILLGNNCANEMGSIVHELGHTLGLYHEHSRPDRDEYITMHPENIIANLTLGIEDENFRKFSEEEMDLFSDVPFDLGSIMIYQTYALSKSPATAPCFEANDKRYTGVIGQRVALSFFDAMAVNKIYGEECIGGRECVHGGYPDPRNCDVCLCPEGLGGEDCSGPDPQSRGCSVESSTITVISAEEKCIMSRDYDVSGFYNRDDTCSYLFKVAAGCDGRIKIRFDTEKFHVYCNTYGVDSQCYHWVEVKHQTDLSLRGIRYCCDEIRDDMVSVTSEGRHMLVTFDARYSVPGNHYVSTDQRKGFKFCYSLESSEIECNTTNETSETERPSSTPSSSPSSNPPSLKSSNPLTSVRPSTSGSSSPIYYFITNVCLIILYLIVMNS